MITNLKKNWVDALLISIVWLCLVGSIVLSAGVYRTGPWTAFEKEKVVRLLEEIAENTRR